MRNSARRTLARRISPGRITGADLGWANLSGANLSKAVFFRAQIDAADLSGANLTGAYVIGANFGGSNLRDADFRGALFFETILANLDLSETLGLDRCTHLGPSVIDFRTLSRSVNLPISFLRGCGLSENLIEYLPSLRDGAIQFYSCFISYSTKDQEFAERLHSDLQSKGVRCWFAPEDLKIGDKLRTRIDESIRVYDKLMVVLSENSIRAVGLKKKSKPPSNGSASRTIWFSSLFVWTMQSCKLSKPGQQPYAVCGTSANSAIGKTTIPIRRLSGDCSGT